MSITWADPPPRSIQPVWATTAAQCRRKPGKWCLLGAQLARSTAWHIETGRYTAFRPVGTFEAQTRNTQGTRADVYVRFVG